MPAPKLKKFQCTYCGIHATSYTRPHPGSCTKKGKDSRGNWKPHSWKKV